MEVARSISADAERLAKQFDQERKAIAFNRDNPGASRDQWEALTKKYRGS